MLSKLFDLRKQKQLVLHISYYFPVRGHSFLPADRVFGRIGQQLKKLDTVLMPEEYLAVLRNHGTVHTYGEDWEAFDYKNEVKRFTKTQRAFKISEAKALEINSDSLGFRSVYYGEFCNHGLLKRREGRAGHSFNRVLLPWLAV